ncbi:MAG: hypothetical protein FJY92_02640 [Candidatus Hydrogenedentes bacterium]|nr:hypothetical protein [Candidatus Hydrogenedentota bacterium]
MFQSMMGELEERVIQTIFRLTDPEVRKTRRIEAQRGTLTAKNDPFASISEYNMVSADKQADRSFASYDTSRFKLAGQDAAAQAPASEEPQQRKVKQEPIRKLTPEVGPNDPCPCGSGKKYKKCCGSVS